MSGLKLKIAFAVTVVSIAALFGFYNLERERAESDSRVKTSGVVEVTEVAVSPLAGGRLIEIIPEEGDSIAKGALVVRLSLDGLDSERKAKIAALERERERLKALERGSRQEDILRSAADLKAKEAQLAQARRDAARFAELLSKDIVSRSEAERYEENVKVLGESVEAAHQQYILLLRGPREEEIAQERHTISQIEAELEELDLMISYKKIHSPASGVVLSKHYETGEVVAAGARIMTIGIMDDPWVKVYVPATQLFRVRVGQSADIYVGSPSLGALSGHVRSVAQEAEFNPRLSLTQEERANQVFWVKVAVSDDSGRVKPGMPADVVFHDFE